MADLAFEMAAQPDMVLSVEKDIFYTRQIKDQLKEIAERVLGPRRAELLDPEVRLLGDLLYYGLTLWAGAETLGQEYVCVTLVQATGGGKLLPLSSPRRAALILTTVLLLYTNKRLVSRGGWEGDFRQLASRPRRPIHPTSQPDESSLAIASEGRRLEGGWWEYAALVRVRGETGAWGQRVREQPVVAAAHQHIRAYAGRAARTLSALRRGYQRSVGPVVGPLLPESTEAGLRLLKRLHLMLFFLDARFYTWAHRLAGAHSMSTRRVREPRASYRVMGIFVAMEMAIRAATTLAHTTQASASAPLIGAPSSSAPPKAPPHDDDDNENDEEGVVEESRKCALCMGPRVDPAATPCGHVYCWSCILSWTANTPECPLCRSPAPPQTILHVVNLGEGGR